MTEVFFGENVNQYDWVPFFIELSKKIAEIGENPNRRELLKARAENCFGSDSNLCAKDRADPFSFIYTLAQKNTINQRAHIYEKVRGEFALNANVPSDWIFPTPPPQYNAGFYLNDTPYDPEILWKLFLEIANSKELDDENFRRVLGTRNIGLAKLTQTLFLINPELFIPLDDHIFFLPVLSENKDLVWQNVKKNGIKYLQKVINEYKEAFPGCEFYEINLFAYLTHSKLLSVNNTYYQIGSNVYGDKDDYKAEFHNKSKVWVGGPSSGDKGIRNYPISNPVPGDIVLSHFNHRGNGIGIVIFNEYATEKGFQNGVGIKVIWINKTEIPQALNTTQMMGFSKAFGIQDSFKVKYPKTFQILENIRKKLNGMNGISKDSVKNLVLQGAPGTGKTRLAKQLALYLKTSRNSLSNFLMDDKILKEDPLFQDEQKIDKDDEQIRLIQFHPGFTYEDFVRGIVTEVVDGRVIYKVEDKIFMKIVKKALDNPDEKYILIIDEMNRANLPSVLGELIYALEYRNEAVSGLYKLCDDDESLIVPDNLYVIGTMNTADRSIGHIDYAIRRRFVFKEVPSEANYISDDKAKDLYHKVGLLFSSGHLSPDFKKEDVMIGHSYFLTNERPLKQRLEFEIIPLLAEYVKDGILIGEGISGEINALRSHV